MPRLTQRTAMISTICAGLAWPVVTRAAPVENLHPYWQKWLRRSVRLLKNPKNERKHFSIYYNNGTASTGASAYHLPASVAASLTGEHIFELQSGFRPKRPEIAPVDVTHSPRILDATFRESLQLSLRFLQHELRVADPEQFSVREAIAKAEAWFDAECSDVPHLRGMFVGGKAAEYITGMRAFWAGEVMTLLEGLRKGSFFSQPGLRLVRDVEQSFREFLTSDGATLVHGIEQGLRGLKNYSQTMIARTDQQAAAAGDGDRSARDELSFLAHGDTYALFSEGQKEQLEVLSAVAEWDRSGTVAGFLEPFARDSEEIAHNLAAVQELRARDASQGTD